MLQKKRKQTPSFYSTILILWL